MAESGMKVAIIGSGLIGRSWSMLFAAADYRVQLYDIEPQQLTGALKEIEAQLDNLSKIGLLRGQLTVKQQLENISVTTDIRECTRGAIYVQTNPPFFAPLVELIPSPWTDPDVVPKAKGIMEKLGQVPVILKKEIEGFVLNRIQYSILKESWRLIKDDVISVDGLDKVMSAGLGRRYAFIGPIEVAYLNADGMHSYAERYGEMIEGIQSTFREADSFSGPHLDKMQKELEALVPMDKLQERRQWRDKRLAALTQLIKKFEDEEK